MLRSAPIAHSPDPLHHNATVVGWGTYTRPSGRYRSYRCRPRSGDIQRFSVKLDPGRPTRSHPCALP